jgi:TusA-related sulfurtransferase
MKLMKSAIRYAYEEMQSGGRIQVKSGDPIGVASIHDFLRFQIADHQTGDSLEVAQK